jgi:predicted transposase YbfD/YdcC
LLPSPQNYFKDLPDPRRTTRNKLHKLQDIIMLTLCALICGCEDWVAIADFSEDNEAWFREFLELPNGIPSHDTLSDVFARIKPCAFEKAFASWMKEGLPGLAGQQIAIDGKTLRRSCNAGERAPHMLSAYATEARLALAITTVEEKANEITAIPDILAQLELGGAVVSIDAMGCQKGIAQMLQDAKADYVLTLKDNHPKLNKAVSSWFAEPENLKGIKGIKSVEKDHGRIETREVFVCTELEWLKQRGEWVGLSAVAMVHSTREVKGEVSCEQRYYLSTLQGSEQLAQAIRYHWAIENSQHWVLDVQFGEDAHRARENHSAANLGVIRRAALNLLRGGDQNAKRSIRRRKQKAMCNLNYRREILFGCQGET